MNNKDPLIYEFLTKSGNRYVYDACSNYTYPAEKIDIEVIRNYYNIKNNGEAEKLNKKYSKDSIAKSFKKISEWVKYDKAFFPPWDGPSEFVSEDEYKKRLENVTQLTLEVTQRCNMRCKYCIFNEDFPLHRNHGYSDMNWDIAKRSIDYFVRLINSPLRANTAYSSCLGFYGGEPLLNFSLLKKCVEYIKTKKLNEAIRFNITTNGTLLNRVIIEFFIEHDFDVLISLDGPKIEHDKNRIFKNGKPTYDILLKNLNILKTINKGYFDRSVSFNSVHTYETDIENVINYFIIEFDNKIPRFDEGDYKINDSPETLLKMKMHNKQKNELFSKYRDFEVNGEKGGRLFNLLNRFFGTDYNRFKRRNYSLPEKFLLNGATCIPGTRKIYVSIDGKFHVCEQVHPGFSIGDCWNGVSYERAKKLYENFKNNILNECNNCIAVHNCYICIARVGENGKLVKYDLCERNRSEFKSFLQFFYSVLEDNQNAFESEIPFLE